MKSSPLVFATAVLFFASATNSFLLPQPSSFAANSDAALNLAKNLEFSVVEDDEEQSENNADFTVIDNNDTAEEEKATTTSSTTFVASHHPKERFEYAALSPGGNTATTTLQIEVGDLALARKAWKKRRRSGSPLLVPCSVLNMDRTSMLRGNLLYLLHKFGTPQKDGVVLSVTDMKRRHKSHLKGPLMKHATALGYETPRELVEALFQGKATQDSCGVRLISEEDELYLKSPLSKYRTLQKAAQATLLQVTTLDEENENESTTMKHTGYIRCKNAESDKPTKDKPYKYPPLSAALRASQKEDVETGNIQQGSVHPAVFFDFDAQGDGGSPLLTLSLNPARRPTAKKSQANNSGKTHPKYTPIRSPRHMLADLKVGEGPYDAKVVRLGKDHALVDFGVGRKFSSQQQTKEEQLQIGTPEFVKVYGMLRFRDAIDRASVMDYNAEEEVTIGTPKKQSAVEKEEDVFASMAELLNKVEDNLDQLEEGEESEDITDLFSLNEDGSLSYDNPETGETETVNSMNEDNDEVGQDEEEEEEEEEEDQPVTFDMSSHLKRLRKPRTIRLRVGDQLPVHILSVAKQSSQFTVTTDLSAVRGKKAKDIKKQSDVAKKLERLSQMLGGLEKAEELKGREYDGTVKATSQTGDWLYVQPNADSEGDDLRLPVGVATVPDESESSSFAQGDLVRIRLDGIDESRGQLAMRVLEKLSP